MNNWRRLPEGAEVIYSQLIQRHIFGFGHKHGLSWDTVSFSERHLKQSDNNKSGIFRGKVRTTKTLEMFTSSSSSTLSDCCQNTAVFSALWSNFFQMKLLKTLTLNWHNFNWLKKNALIIPQTSMQPKCVTDAPWWIPWAPFLKLPFSLWSILWQFVL